MFTGTYRIRVIPVPFDEMKDYIPPEEQQSVQENQPAPPPEHTLTLGMQGALPYGIYETEHGQQLVGNLCYTGEVLRFSALAGTPGDEFFLYALREEGEGLSGEAWQPGKPRSRVTGVKISAD